MLPFMKHCFSQVGNEIIEETWTLEEWGFHYSLVLSNHDSCHLPPCMHLHEVPWCSIWLKFYLRSRQEAWKVTIIIYAQLPKTRWTGFSPGSNNQENRFHNTHQGNMFKLTYRTQQRRYWTISWIESRMKI